MHTVQLLFLALPWRSPCELLDHTNQVPAPDACTAAQVLRVSALGLGLVYGSIKLGSVQVRNIDMFADAQWPRQRGKTVELERLCLCSQRTAAKNKAAKEKEHH